MNARLAVTYSPEPVNNTLIFSSTDPEEVGPKTLEEAFKYPLELSGYLLFPILILAVILPLLSKLRVQDLKPLAPLVAPLAALYWAPVLLTLCFLPLFISVSLFGLVPAVLFLGTAFATFWLTQRAYTLKIQSPFRLALASVILGIHLGLITQFILSADLLHLRSDTTLNSIRTLLRVLMVLASLFWISLSLLLEHLRRNPSVILRDESIPTSLSLNI